MIISTAIAIGIFLNLGVYQILQFKKEELFSQLPESDEHLKDEVANLCVRINLLEEHLHKHEETIKKLVKKSTIEELSKL